MAFDDIKNFCEVNNVPITAVTCSPKYDNNKGRVTKGATKCHPGWKQNNFQLTTITNTPFDENKPTMWMMSLKKQNLIVIDIDVKNGKSAKDILTDEIYATLYDKAKYVIQTGSNGLHFYFKLPDNFDGKVQDYINIDAGNDFFKEGEEGSVDIIMDSIITEGSQYTYENVVYKYTNIKPNSTINDVEVWEEFQEFYNKCIKINREQKNKTIIDSNVNKEEIIEHLNNIPNTTNNWDYWYRMGQTLFNIFGFDGYELFRDWSSKANCFDERATFNLWKGLTLSSNNSDPRTIGSIYYLSKQSNEEEYYKIRNKYGSGFWNLLKTINHYDVAKYFYNLKPYAYIYNSGFGWFSLQNNNIWNYSEKKPSTLISDIAESFKIICNQKKNELDMADESSKEKIKQLLKFHNLIGTLSFCDSVATFLQSFYEDNNVLDKMDCNKNLFAFTDKVYNLDTDEVRNIEPTDYISITTGYKFPTSHNPKIKQEIKKFLWSLFENDEMVQFEIDKLTYALHGNKKLEKFIIETGEGRNGKGTKSKLIQLIFGNYYVSIPISTFTKPNDKKDAPNPALVSCRGKRYIEAQEPEKNDRLQVGTLKEITGNDIISCRGLFGKSLLKFIVQGLLNIQSNGVPLYNKLDNAIIKRNIIQPFPFEFVSPSKKDLKDNERYGNCNLKNIINNEWRDEFILMLIENNSKFREKNELTLPNAIVQRTEENADDNIPIKEWVDTYVKKEIGNKNEIKSSVLYVEYTNNTNRAVNQTSFVSYMKLLGFENKRKSDGVYWINIVLNTPAQIRTN